AGGAGSGQGRRPPRGGRAAAGARFHSGKPLRAAGRAGSAPPPGPAELPPNRATAAGPARTPPAPPREGGAGPPTPGRAGGAPERGSTRSPAEGPSSAA